MRSKIIGSGMSGDSYVRKMLTVQPATNIGIWPLWEPSGTVVEDLSGAGRDGVYTAVTLGGEGIGDGRTSPLFNGTSSYANLYSVSLRDAFNGDVGTFLAWIKPDVASWTDGAVNDVGVFAADGSNYLYLRKTTVNGQLQWIHVGGGTAKTVSQAGYSFTDFTLMSLTWDNGAADAMKAYLAGAQVGVTQTGLGDWAGNIIATQSLLGASATTPSNEFGGYLAYAGLWTSVLTLEEITYLSTL